MLTTIIGHRGFIGAHLARTLGNAGVELFLPERDAPDLVRRPLGTVYYCAGLTADFARFPLQTVEAHVGLLARLLDAATFDRLVYLSSTRLYDGIGAAAASEHADLPFSPENPRHLFDLSKALGEALCLQVGQKRARVARLSSVYSDEMREPNFLSSLVAQVVGADRVELSTSMSSMRDYIHVSDAVSLLRKIAASDAGGIYNLGSGLNVSNQEIFDVVKQVTGCVIIAKGPMAAPSPVIDISRIKAEFGFQPASLCERLAAILRHRMSVAGKAI